MHHSNAKWHVSPGLLAGVPLTAAASAVFSAEAPVTLKDAYKDIFPIGTAVNRSMMTGGAGFPRSADLNASGIAMVGRHFNQIVAVNDMKWQLIHPRPGEDGYDFTGGVRL